MERAPEICILCQTSEREILIQTENWIVYRCRTCGLDFLDPRPSESEIEDLYQSDYFSEQYDGGIDPESSQYKQRL
ncbi:MAG: hypothetical protein P8X90_32435, partial [Desulfobacterales bacterium]